MAAASRPAIPWNVPGARWACLGERSSGATVYRVSYGDEPVYYVKTTPPRHRDDPRFDPAGDADRLSWLSKRGLPVPEVVAAGTGDQLCWIVTTALPGRPAAGPWTHEEQLRVIDVFADAARALHALPVGECPFERRQADVVRQARAAIELGAVDLDDVDTAHENWTAQQLWDKLSATEVPPEDDLVVCHGDLYLDNVLIDPQTLTLSGIIDVDRLGIADRWHDLSLALYSIGCVSAGRSRDEGPAFAERFARRYGGITPDHRKMAYYQMLDEFL